MSWNGFPNYISKALLHRLKSNVRNRDAINEINNNKDNKENITEIFFLFTLRKIKRWTISQTLLKEDKTLLKD